MWGLDICGLRNCSEFLFCRFYFHDSHGHKALKQRKPWPSRMLSMIADEESEGASASDSNGNKQLFPSTVTGLLPKTKNLSTRPPGEQEGN